MDIAVLTKTVTTDELNAIMPQMARLIGESVSADHCGVFAYSEDQTATIAYYRYGYDEQMLQAHKSATPLSPTEAPAEARVLRTGEPLMRVGPEDFAEIPLVSAGQEEIEQRRCDLVVPLVWEGRVQGSAYVWRTGDPEPFSQSEIDAAVSVGRMAGMAIVFARQHEQERVQRQRLDTLLNVANLITSEQGLDDILQTLARSIRGAAGTDVCCLYVFDETGDEVLAAFRDGARPDEGEVLAGSEKHSVSEVPVEVELRRTLAPKLIQDFHSALPLNDPLLHHLVENDVQELLTVPISYQGELIGVVYCWNRDAERRFSAAAMDITEAIANQAGGVLARARLQQAIEQQRAESEALLRIGQAVLTQETLPPVLDEIAAVLHEMIDFDYAYVGLLNADGTGIRVIREWGESYRPILHRTIPVDASISGIAVRSRRPVSSDNVQNDSRGWLRDPKLPPLRSVAVAPLLTQQGPIGTLFIARDLVHVFTPAEELLLAILAQQAAVAIDRVRSRENLAQQAHRQALLASVGEQLVMADNPFDVLHEIAESSAGVIADGVAFVQFDWENGSSSIVVSAFGEIETDDALQDGIRKLDVALLDERIEQILVSNKELLLELDQIRPENQMLRELLEGLGAIQMMILPLYLDERPPGMMILISTEESGPFQDEDVELARIVARRIGDAMERYLIKQNQEALLRISEVLHGQSDVESLIQSFARELAEILPFDQFYIGDYDPDGNVLKTRYYREADSEQSGPAELPADIGVCGEVLRSKLPILDNEADQRFSSVYHGEEKDTHYRACGESILVAPILIDDDVTGVMFMNRTGHKRFTTVDFETFLLFTGLAGAALDRTSLVQRNRELYRASVEVLAAVVDAKDPMTLEHSRHVAEYSRLAAELMELPPDAVERIELAGLLHDIGKLGIPDSVLRKSGRLTDDEFELIKTHPDRGARILERHPALVDLVPLVRHHHEAANGHGYPSRLAGDSIPLGASIICVADAFDTMTSERTYQNRRPVDDALSELERCAGTQFRADIVERFVSLIRENPHYVFSARPAEISASDDTRVRR